jgi:peptidoglycan-N-acetylglucosamine deacetylase
MNRLGLAATVAGGAMAAGAVAQVLPAAVAWRTARVRLLPGLSGVGRPGHVALTFDDGPDPRSTPAFLDELDTLGWKATFFMLGRNAAAAPELTTEVARRGHELAVHGYWHQNHLWRGPRWAARSFAEARDTVARLAGPCPQWARPPYGALSTASLLGAHRAGLRTVLWTTWGRDWREAATPETIVDDVLATMVPGATVLLHDSDCTSTPDSWKATLASLAVLAELWQAQGLEVGPLRDHGA